MIPKSNLPSTNMTTLNPGKIYEKYQAGDKLTNAEVIYGAAFYKDLSDRLVYCGPTFHLAFTEANRVYMGLDGYLEARMKK